MIADKPFFEEIMKRRCFLSSVAFLSLSGFILPIRALGSVAAKGVRVGKNGKGSRFVLDVSDEVSYTMFFLSEPKRLVIDLPLATFTNLAGELVFNDDLITRVRFGEDASRVVLDLNSAVKLNRVFMLPPQSGFDWRFVIDLEKTTEDDFAAKIGANNAVSNIDSIVRNNDQLSDYPPRPGVKPQKDHRPSRQPVIVLDPGHGGRDPGAIGITGVFEKDITLAMGLELRKKLEKTGGYQVALTRSRDETLSLRKRVEIAREARGDLFISLHADSIAKRDIKGLSIYTLSEKASDAEAAALAVRENKADIIAGIDLYNELPEVANFLIDLTRRETMNLSAEYATIMVNKMLNSFTLLRNTHRFANFAVLKAPDVPSVLFEMGYLSNPQEEKLLKQSSYREKLAEATMASISKYFSSPQRASLF